MLCAVFEMKTFSEYKIIGYRIHSLADSITMRGLSYHCNNDIESLKWSEWIINTNNSNITQSLHSMLTSNNLRLFTWIDPGWSLHRNANLVVFVPIFGSFLLFFLAFLLTFFHFFYSFFFFHFFQRKIWSVITRRNIWLQQQQSHQKLFGK